MQYEGEGTCRSGLGQQSGCDIQGPHRAGCCGAEQDGAGWQLRGGLQAPPDDVSGHVQRLVVHGGHGAEAGVGVQDVLDRKTHV